MPELMENPACQVCGELLKPKERGNSENLAYSKDKTRSYYICNKCRKETVTDARTGKGFHGQRYILCECESMKKCPKCDGKGGIMWITSAGTDAIWEYCEKCGGTGEVKDD